MIIPKQSTIWKLLSCLKCFPPSQALRISSVAWSVWWHRLAFKACYSASPRNSPRCEVFKTTCRHGIFQQLLHFGLVWVFSWKFHRNAAIWEKHLDFSGASHSDNMGFSAPLQSKQLFRFYFEEIWQCHYLGCCRKAACAFPHLLMVSEHPLCTQWSV